MAIQKLKGGRVNNVVADDHIGDKGSLFYNEDLGDLRLSDGITKGGIPLTALPTSESAPALLSSTAPAVGRPGSMWYDTSTSTLNISQNGAWEPIASPDDNGSGPIDDLAIGHGLKLDQNKALAVDVDAILVPATTTSLGHVIVGDGLAVDSAGRLSVDIQDYQLPQASSSSIGGVSVGDGLSIDSAGKLSVDLQTYHLPQATTTSIGGVIVGDGLKVDPAGTVAVDLKPENIPQATTTTVGGVIVGDGLTVDSTGVVSADVQPVPMASRTILGGIKIGDGFVIDENGVLGVATFLNTDGGSVSTNYGGVNPLDGGGI